MAAQSSAFAAVPGDIPPPSPPEMPHQSDSRRLHLDERDAHDRLELEKEDDQEKEADRTGIIDPASPDDSDHSDEPELNRHNYHNNQNDLTIPQSRDGKDIIAFEHDDPDNPFLWSWKRKYYVVFVGVMLVINSTIGSSMASGIPVELQNYFHNDNQEQLILPTSIYLIGYVLGPLLFGPLSESFGRKPVLVATYALFTIFTMACALANTFAALCVFRFIVGVGASSPISVVGGLYADIYSDPVTRGRALTVFMTATTWGPLIGPVLSGFAGQALGWRWVFWIALIFAAACWPILVLMPETYGPTILKNRARRLRKKNPHAKVYAPIELEKTDLKSMVTVILTRPLRMLCYEAIVSATCLYLAYLYAIFYIFFEAFPIIFIGTYGFNYGEEGLTFIPVGIGAVMSCAIYLSWDFYLERAKARGAPWSKQEEYRRLPLACLGGPLIVLALFWIGWTARKDIHWIVPVLAAIPFGVGFLLLFMALTNYLVDAYEIFAASAVAASSSSRSLFGAILPFAAKPMYDALGVPWACSLLGFLSLAMCAIPFVFIKYGDKIREKSKFCQELKAEKTRIAERKERDQARIQRQKERRGEVGPEKMA